MRYLACIVRVLEVPRLIVWFPQLPQFWPDGQAIARAISVLQASKEMTDASSDVAAKGKSPIDPLVGESVLVAVAETMRSKANNMLDMTDANMTAARY